VSKGDSTHDFGGRDICSHLTGTANTAWEEGRRTGFDYAIALALEAQTSPALKLC